MSDIHVPIYNLLNAVGLRPLPVEALPLLDLAGITFATALSVRATSPPHFATDEAKSKARGRDSISNLGVTKRHVGRPIRLLPYLWVAKRLVEQSWGNTEQAADVRKVFWVGNALICLGSIGRLVCHHTLGKFFTFDLAVQSDQKVRGIRMPRVTGLDADDLVRSSQIIDKGPYGIVRHPAYTSTVLLMVGTTLSSFFGSPGFSMASRKTVAVAGVAWCSLTIVSLSTTPSASRSALQKLMPFPSRPFAHLSLISSCCETVSPRRRRCCRGSWASSTRPTCPECPTVSFPTCTEEEGE